MMVFAELIIPFELDTPKSLEIDYNCRCVQIETILEDKNSHKQGKYKTINFTWLFYISSQS